MRCMGGGIWAGGDIADKGVADLRSMTLGGGLPAPLLLIESRRARGGVAETGSACIAAEVGADARGGGGGGW